MTKAQKQEAFFLSLMKKLNYNSLGKASMEAFKKDIARYVKASQQNRLLCVVRKVSSTGNSRVMEFLEFDKHPTNQIKRYYLLFEMLGYKYIEGGVRVRGVGMDMAFSVHHSIVNQLADNGFITEKTKKEIENNRPNVI